MIPRMNRRVKKLLSTLIILSAFISASIATNPLQSLSKKLKKGMKFEKSLSVAILDFSYARGRMSSGSRIVPERLTTYLVQAGVRVVERRLIQQLMEEKKLTQTGVVDFRQIKNRKELAGVDALVIGTLSDLSNETTEVVARVVKVDTAEVLASGTVVIYREWNDFPKMPQKNNSRTPVPFANSQLGFGEEVSRKHTLGEMDRPKKRAQYFPAPVPFFMPPAPGDLR